MTGAEITLLRMYDYEERLCDYRLRVLDVANSSKSEAEFKQKAASLRDAIFPEYVIAEKARATDMDKDFQDVMDNSYAIEWGGGAPALTTTKRSPDAKS